MKKQNYIIVVLCAILLSVNGFAQSAHQMSEKQIADINQLVEDLSNKDKFSGTVLIAKGNKILYQKAVGFADKEHNSKNNIDTKFNLASMNKMFTAVAIAQLVEKNKLSYSDKVIQYLPNLPEKIFGKITIEQLLTHTSGTGNVLGTPEFMYIKDTAKTIASYVQLGINETLSSAPGTKFEYSNYGFILLGAVIEKISEMSYFDYVKKNIFAVANMPNTDSYENDKALKNRAIGYALPPPMPGQQLQPVGEKIVREPNTKFIEVKGTSAGGGYSTAIDLHKFSLALLSKKLLSAKSVETITTGKITMPKPPTPPNAKPSPDRKYGFGFGEVFKNNVRIIGHNGGAPGIEGQVDIYPDLGYTVVVLSNYDRATSPIIKFIEETIITKH
jgi:CubicO group peptidase (beta-lactamase class C family)